MFLYLNEDFSLQGYCDEQPCNDSSNSDEDQFYECDEEKEKSWDKPEGASSDILICPTLTV